MHIPLKMPLFTKSLEQYPLLSAVVTGYCDNDSKSGDFHLKISVLKLNSKLKLATVDMIISSDKQKVSSFNVLFGRLEVGDKSHSMEHALNLFHAIESIYSQTLLESIKEDIAALMHHERLKQIEFDKIMRTHRELNVTSAKSLLAALANRVTVLRGTQQSIPTPASIQVQLLIPGNDNQLEEKMLSIEYGEIMIHKIGGKKTSRDKAFAVLSNSWIPQIPQYIEHGYNQKIAA